MSDVVNYATQDPKYKLKDKDILIYLDNSLSMRGSGARFIIKNIPEFAKRFPGAYVQYFGSDVMSDGSLINILKTDPSYGNRTYTAEFLGPVGRIDPPVVIIIISDGSFTDDRFSERLKTLAGRGFLENLKTFMVFFIPGTTDRDKGLLSEDLTQFCTAREDIVVSPSFTDCVHGEDTFLLREFEEKQVKTLLIVPPGFINVFCLLSFSPDMIMSELAKEILGKEKLIKDIFDKMKNIITNRPQELLSNTCAKLHKLLHILFRDNKEYADYISTIMRSSSEKKKNILKKLIQNSFMDEVENERLRDSTRNYWTGEHISIQHPEDLLDAIRSKTMFPDKVKETLETARSSDKGFAIHKDYAPQDKNELAYRLFFYPYLISEQLATILLLTIMTSTADLPESFLNMTKRTVFGMKETIKRQVFDDPDPIFFSAKICAIVAKFLSLFHHEIFPEPTEQEREKIYDAMQTSRFYGSIGVIDSAIDKKIYIDREIPVNGPMIPQENSIVELAPFDGDTQKNLPSVAYIKKVEKKGDGYKVTVEYLDKLNGTGDTHRYFYRNSSEIDFRLLAGVSRPEDIERYNMIVMKMADREDWQGEKDKTKHDEALEEITRNFPPMPPQPTKKIKAPVPRDILTSILIENPLIAKLVSRGQNPNMKDIKQAISSLEEKVVIKTDFIYNSMYYTLEEKDILEIKKEFENRIKELSPSFNLSILKEEDCPVCLEICAIKDMKKEPCGHLLCHECSEKIKPDYSNGEVNEFEHVCPLCRELIRFENQEVTAWLSLPREEREKVPRFCLTCKVFFLQEPPACGGGEDAIQKHCDGCKVSRYRPCPGCTVMIEHVSDCDKMHCTNCDTSFCFVCGYMGSGLEHDIYNHLREVHGGLYTIQGLRILDVEHERYDDYDYNDDDYNDDDWD